MLAVTNKTNYKLHIKPLIFANKARTVKLPKVFKFLLNSNTGTLDLIKQGRLFQLNVPLKCAEFVPYTVDFED